jgi:hypothetical protein
MRSQLLQSNQSELEDLGLAIAALTALRRIAGLISTFNHCFKGATQGKRAKFPDHASKIPRRGVTDSLQRRLTGGGALPCLPVHLQRRVRVKLDRV